MKLIVDFYKELDAFNLILFWGVIIVIVLLLIFAVIMINKNKKLEKIIISNGLDINDDDDTELAIKKENSKVVKEEEKIITPVNVIENTHHEEKTVEVVKPQENAFFVNEVKTEIPEVTIEKTVETPKEEPVKEVEEVIKTDPPKNFIPEEYVMDHSHQTAPVVPNIPVEEEKRVPYGKNVLREMSLNQTSPIGIVRKPSENSQELTNARELNTALNTPREIPNEEVNRPTIITTERPNNITLNETYHEKPVERPQQKYYEDSYRTAYEIEQENEAIISFDELMKRKDEIKIVDEEDAVISIQELVNREKEKLYNITKDEKDEKFIDELKKFRSDL